MSMVDGYFTKMDNDFLIDEEDDYKVILEYFLIKYHSAKYAVLSIEDILDEIEITSKAQRERAIKEFTKVINKKDYFTYDKFGNEIEEFTEETKIYFVLEESYRNPEDNYTAVSDNIVSYLVLELRKSENKRVDKVKILRYLLRCCRITNTGTGYGYLSNSKTGISKVETILKYKSILESSGALWFYNDMYRLGQQMTTRVCNPLTLDFKGKELLYDCKEDFIRKLRKDPNLRGYK